MNLKRYFTCDHFSESYGGLKIAILANLGQLTIVDLLQYLLQFGTMFAIVDFLQGAKSFLLYFNWRVGG